VVKFPVNAFSPWFRVTKEDPGDLIGHLVDAQPALAVLVGLVVGGHVGKKLIMRGPERTTSAGERGAENGAWRLISGELWLYEEEEEEGVFPQREKTHLKEMRFSHLINVRCAFLCICMYFLSTIMPNFLV